MIYFPTRKSVIRQSLQVVLIALLVLLISGSVLLLKQNAEKNRCSEIGKELNTLVSYVDGRCVVHV